MISRFLNLQHFNNLFCYMSRVGKITHGRIFVYEVDFVWFDKPFKSFILSSPPMIREKLLKTKNNTTFNT